MYICIYIYKYYTYIYTPVFAQTHFLLHILGVNRRSPRATVWGHFAAHPMLTRTRAGLATWASNFACDQSAMGILRY